MSDDFLDCGVEVDEIGGVEAVMLRVGDNGAYLTPAEARNIAAQLIAAAQEIDQARIVSDPKEKPPTSR